MRVLLAYLLLGSYGLFIWQWHSNWKKTKMLKTET